MTTSPPATLPTARPAGCPFDPPAELGRLREQQPLSPLAYPDGHVGWLATSHALVRAVLSDPRFSARAELAHNPIPGATTTTATAPTAAPPGMLPYADRSGFQQHSNTLLSLDRPAEYKIAAYTELTRFMTELVRVKRRTPADDVLSDLAATGLDDEELANIGFMLLVAGHETTANMLSLGTFALLQHPDQLAALRSDPAATVEELLRHLSVVPLTVRVALEDVELGGQVVRAGETVTVSLSAANRDPAHLAAPERLDAEHPPNGHLAFGHGIHQCLGQQLARIEMQVGFPALFDRFPNLRLASTRTAAAAPGCACSPRRMCSTRTRTTAGCCCSTRNRRRTRKKPCARRRSCARRQRSRCPDPVASADARA